MANKKRKRRFGGRVKPIFTNADKKGISNIFKRAWRRGKSSEVKIKYE